MTKRRRGLARGLTNYGDMDFSLYLRRANAAQSFVLGEGEVRGRVWWDSSLAVCSPPADVFKHGIETGMPPITPLVRHGRQRHQKLYAFPGSVVYNRFRVLLNRDEGLQEQQEPITLYVTHHPHIRGQLQVAEWGPVLFLQNHQPVCKVDPVIVHHLLEA